MEHIVAALRPQPAMPSSVRKLPAALASDVPSTRPQAAEPVRLQPRPEVVSDSVPSPLKRTAVVAPIAPAQYKVQITVSAGTYEKLRRAQDLLRHTIPNGDPAVIFDRALTLLPTNLEKTKLAAVTRPQAPRSPAPRSRHVPAAIRREVWKRDIGQCAFIGRDGRCSERGFLEVHHVAPYATGGATTAENPQLRYRAHNAYESEQYFGSLWVRESLLGRYDSQLGLALLCQIDVDGRCAAGRGGSAAGAAPRAGKPLPARTLPLPRRLRTRVDDMCQAH